MEVSAGFFCFWTFFLYDRQRKITLLRVLGLRLGLERDLLVDDDGGGGALGVHIALAPGHLDLIYQGEDDQDHRDVEYKVHDRDPILITIDCLAFGNAL